MSRIPAPVPGFAVFRRFGFLFWVLVDVLPLSFLLEKEKMNRLCRLLDVAFPVIQGGMVWCSGWRLAAAVSNEGGLGVIGAGSMYPEVLREHIVKCQEATDKPFGVNLPLMYPQVDDLVQMITELKVPVVITSAGSPAKYTSYFHSKGAKVLHVVSNLKFALKCQQAGVDAVIGEGFEAGGHNGSEETTTLVLMQVLRPELSIPLIAAGGIGSGRAILAAMALGAEGVQIGSLFAAAEESSAHEAFKQQIVMAGEGDTMLSLKPIGGVRLLKNQFYDQVRLLEQRGGSPDDFRELLGRGRAKLGIFEGDTTEGELEIGQIAACIQRVEPVKEIMDRLKRDFQQVGKELFQHL